MQTTVKRSGLGHGESGTCRYIGDDKKQAHNLAQLLKRYADDPKMLKYINQHDTKRNIALAGIGVRTCGWKYTARDFHRLSHLKPHNKVKTINIIISPQRGTINPHNLEQVEQFKRLCIKYGKTVFPHHKIYIAIQHDNKGGKRSRGGITHAHLIVSSLSTLPPHNALKGWQYDNHYLRTRYNEISKEFNGQQNVIKLGQAVYTKHNRAPKPSATEDWLVQKSQAPLDELEAGKLANPTAFHKAFKKQGITVKLTRHRHRMHLTDDDGNLVYHTDKRGRRHKIPLYRKYTSGRRKGQYQYRTNKHGNKSKIPKYSYSSGLMLKPIKYQDSRPKRKRRYIKGSRMESISGDHRFNGTWVATTLYQIKKGHYHIPFKYRQEPSLQQSANGSNIVSNTAEVNSSSSTPTQSELASKALKQRIISEENVSELTPSYATSNASSSSSNTTRGEHSKTGLDAQNKAYEEAREAQWSAQHQQQLLIKQTEAKKAKQRKEKQNERRRLSATYSKQFKELSRKSDEEFKGLAEDERRRNPVNTRPGQQHTEARRQSRFNRRRQGHTSTITRTISSISRAIKNVKQIRIRTEIHRTRRRIVKAINKRIARVRERVRQRIANIKQDIKRHRIRKRQRQHQREQGGMHFE